MGHQEWFSVETVAVQCWEEQVDLYIFPTAAYKYNDAHSQLLDDSKMIAY